LHLVMRSDLDAPRLMMFHRNGTRLDLTISGWWMMRRQADRLCALENVFSVKL